jgi:hypothetical protein
MNSGVPESNAAPFLTFEDELTVQGTFADEDLSYKHLKTLLERGEKTGLLKNAQISHQPDGSIVAVVPGKHDLKTQEPYQEIYTIRQMQDGGIHMSSYQFVETLRGDNRKSTEIKGQITYDRDGHPKNIQIEEAEINAEGQVETSVDTINYAEGSDKMLSSTSVVHTKQPNSTPDSSDGYTTIKATEERYVDGKLSHSGTIETRTNNDGGSFRTDTYADVSPATGSTVETSVAVDRKMMEQDGVVSERVTRDETYEVRDTESGRFTYRKKDSFVEGAHTGISIAEFNRDTGRYTVNEKNTNPDGSWSEASSTSKNGGTQDQVGEKRNYNADGILVSTETAVSDYAGWGPPVYEPGFSYAQQIQAAIAAHRRSGP